MEDVSAEHRLHPPSSTTGRIQKHVEEKLQQTEAPDLTPTRSVWWKNTNESFQQTTNREHRLFLACEQMTNAVTLSHESAENRCREVTQPHSEEVTHLIHESYL